VLRLLVFITFLVIAGSCPEHCPADSSSASPPNILFAIADDWGRHAGAYGTPWVSTPAFDRVAREGLLFRNALTPMAKCAPSRAIVLTGRHLWQLEEAGNHMARFPAKFRVWPEVLADRGWHVGMTGKGWGPGIAEDSSGKPRTLTGKPWNTRRAAAPTSQIAPNDYAANFRDFLDAAPEGQPWCFWFGSLEPHRGYEFQSGVNRGGRKLDEIDRVPAYWPDEETVRHDLLDYAFEVEHTDRHLGRMLQELESRGMLDNTLVIVTSDHGMPFPRAKGYAWPASCNVPLAIRWPQGIPVSGRAIDDFVSFVDLAPTILDYAGCDPTASGMQPITGNSLRRILESSQSGRIEPSRDHALVGKERTDVGRPGDAGYPIRGIVTHSHLLLKNYEPSRWPAGNPESGYPDTDGSPTKSLILQRGRTDRSDRFWMLNFGLQPAESLYDLQNDPDCIHSLAGLAEHQELQTTLLRQLETELKSQGDPRMVGNGGIFDAYRPTSGAGFHELILQGKRPPAGWLTPSDFEPVPLQPER
jgi:N-sulfoglucosamine sulfohydrolase